jgi:FtsH-binding integral membrane protein
MIFASLFASILFSLLVNIVSVFFYLTHKGQFAILLYSSMMIIIFSLYIIIDIQMIKEQINQEDYILGAI